MARTPKLPLYLVSCIDRDNVLVPTTSKAKLIPHRHLHGLIAMTSIHTLVVGGQLEVQLGSKSPAALAILPQNSNSFIKRIPKNIPFISLNNLMGYLIS